MRNLVLLDREDRYVDISEDVVAEVVMHTLDQIEKVSYAGGRKGMNQWLSRNRDKLKDIEEGASLSFDVRIRVPYGENIVQNARIVQEKLVEQFMAFFDVSNVTFDIMVEGFNNLEER